MGKRDLKRILKKCETLDISINSKIVFISDVHRGDAGTSDSLVGNKNIYLAAINYYYKEGYTLIEIGDGDELWKNKDCKDIAYNYKDVFSIYNRFNSDNRLYMIYGNHDKIKSKKDFKEQQRKKFQKIGGDFGEDFINLISKTKFYEGLVINFKPYNKKGLVVHGHQLDIMNNELAFFSRFLVRYFWRVMEGFFGFKTPNSPASSYKKGNKIDKDLNDWASENKIILICGHTHRVRFPKAGEGTYFNDGSCVLPHSITSIEINKGLIALVKWNIDIGKDNNLYIKRSFLEGPERLDSYLNFVNN